MPHADNAAIKLAAAVTALAADQSRRAARVIPVVAGFLEAIGLGEVARLAEADPVGDSGPAGALVADPVMRRSLDAMLRDTVTPTVLQSGQEGQRHARRGRGGGRRPHPAGHRPGRVPAAPAGRGRRRRHGRVGRDPAGGRVAGGRGDRRAHARRAGACRSRRHRGADDDHARDRCKGARPARHPVLRLRAVAPGAGHAVPVALPRPRRARAGQRAGIRPAGPGRGGGALRPSDADAGLDVSRPIEHARLYSGRSFPWT